MTRLTLLIAAALFALSAAFAQSAPLPVGPKDPLVIVSGETEHAFDVEMADTPEEIRTGMMFRTEMAETDGMLFDFGDPREANMYMRNTLIPLDMLFLDTDGTILAIAHSAAPESERIINPGVDVQGVLELKGGVALSLGLKPGDKVRHALFGNLAAQ